MSEAPPEGRIVTATQDRVLTIGIDRPRKLNGFTPEMVRQLAQAYTDYERDDGLWCAVLYAEGDHFTAGLQLDRFDITASFVPGGLVDPLGLRAPVRRKPLVSAVQGICFTIGIEFMLASDIAIAADNTRFGQLEVTRGLFAFGGATIRMVERAGWGNAMRWLLTGEEFGPDEALRVGFVQEVVPAGEQLQRALTIAQRIASQAPLAVTATRESALMSLASAEQAIARMPLQLAELAQSDDFAEGVRSFKERREGRYHGR